MLTDLFDEVFGADDLADATVPPDGAAARWRIRFADNRATILTVAPAMTSIEVRARHPDATVIERILLPSESLACPPSARPYERAALFDWPIDALHGEACDLRRVVADARAEGLVALADAVQDEVDEVDAEIRSRVPVVAQCSTCAHQSKHGNCGEPVKAGIAARFELVRHSAAGIGCCAYKGADS